MNAWPSLRRRASGTVWRSAVALGACASIAYACVIYPTSLLLPADPDAGPPVDTCDHAFAPVLDDAAVPDPSEKTIQITFALTDLRFDNLAQAHEGSGLLAAPGFDLDGVCACEGKTACVGPLGAECTERGRNNAFALVASALGGSTTEPNGWVGGGHATNLIRLENYNGTANDPEVALRYYASQGYTPGADAAVPRRDGTDIWTVEPGSTLIGDAGLGRNCTDDAGGVTCAALLENQDTKAFVKDGVLTARPRGPMRLMFPLGYQRDVFGRLNSPVITAKIEQTDAGVWKLTEGVVAGRLEIVQYLASLAEAPNLILFDQNRPLVRLPAACEDPNVWSLLREKLCNIRDLPASSEDDGKQAACGAVSITTSFQAIQSVMGKIAQPTRRNTCPPNFDPGTCP